MKSLARSHLYMKTLVMKEFSGIYWLTKNLNKFLGKVIRILNKKKEYLKEFGLRKVEGTLGDIKYWTDFKVYFRGLDIKR